MLRTFTIFLALFLFAALNAFASYSNLGESRNHVQKLVSDKTYFNNWFFQHSEFQCPDPLTRDKMVINISKIVFTGLQRLYPINPDLVSLRLNQITGTKIKFMCGDMDEENVGAVTVQGWFYHGKAGLILNLTGNLIIVPSARFNTEFKYVDTDWTSVIVFHEYLHALKFDNLPVYIHNSFGDPQSEFKTHFNFGNDLVYSATELAYHMPSYRLNRRNACYLLAMSEDQNGEIRVNSHRAKYADQICEIFNFQY